MKGKAKDALIGTIAASGMADNDPNPKWQAFVKAYQQHAKTGYFKNAFASPRCSPSTTKLGRRHV